MSAQNPFADLVSKLRPKKSATPSVNQADDIRMQLQKLQQEKEKLATDKKMLSNLLADISEALITIDLNYLITTVNRSAESITGYTNTHIIGKKISDVLNFAEGTTVISPQVYTAQMQNGVYVKKGIKAIAQKKEVNINLTVKPFTDGENRIGFILSLVDITEEKQLEEMKLDFVSMAAHELRTPITAIKGYYSAFVEENKNVLNEDQKQLLAHVGVAAEQLLALVENLLNVSRVERGAFTVMLEPLDWASKAQFIVDEFQERAREKQITLQYIPPAVQLPQINADKIRITEVLSNLIANAITYTQPNGTIKVWIELQGQEIITHIQDTGVGIPKESVGRLFTKFYRVSSNLAQISKGTGLGLYISKEIIQLHHGRIWVESELGKGSVFSFAVPVYQAPPSITVKV